MTYDSATSKEMLVFLKFAVNMSTKPHHPREFADKNKEVIACLSDDDKEVLRATYREVQTKLRKV